MQLKDRFLTVKYRLKKRLANRWRHIYCATRLAASKRLPMYPPPQARPERDCGRRLLYASPVGAAGKYFLSKIINRFGHEEFDYLIWVYDDTEFIEPVFKKCRFIYEKGIICYFLKKYLTPEYCAPYEYIFAWVDDLDIDRFDYQAFLNIMERNRLELCQPAVSYHSLRSHELTVKHRQKVGRLTDFVEVMAMVFTNQAWNRYWQMLEPDWGHWGWGYNHLLRSVCGIERLGIVDCQSISHLKLGSSRTSAPQERDRLLNKYKDFLRAEQRNEGVLL